MTRRVLTMSEAQMQGGIVATARQMGWLCHFVPDALYRRSFANKRSGHNALDLGDRGFPDLVLIPPTPGLAPLFRELKVGSNTLSEHQEAWRDRLVGAGADWALWHGDDYDEVLALLRGEM